MLIDDQGQFLPSGWQMAASIWIAIGGSVLVCWVWLACEMTQWQLELTGSKCVSRLVIWRTGWIRLGLTRVAAMTSLQLLVNREPSAVAAPGQSCFKEKNSENMHICC